MQKYKNKIWHLVVYYSYKLTLLKLNYNIYNKKLLAVVAVLKNKECFYREL